MASFVREILSATGHLGEKEDLCAKATRLRGRVDELKVILSNCIIIKLMSPIAYKSPINQISTQNFGNSSTSVSN